MADRTGAARRAKAWVVHPLLSSSALAWHDVAAAAPHEEPRGDHCGVASRATSAEEVAIARADAETGRCRGGQLLAGRCAAAHALAHAHTRTRQPSPSCRLPTPLSTLAISLPLC